MQLAYIFESFPGNDAVDAEHAAKAAKAANLAAISAMAKMGFVPDLPIRTLTPTHISNVRKLTLLDSPHPQEASHSDGGS